MTSSQTQSSASLWAQRAGWAVALVAGCLVIFQVNHWHWNAPVFFLLLGWGSIVATLRLLWGSLTLAAAEPESEKEQAGTATAGRRGDLLREKKALLRAIKDVEFDRDMGKMSDSEALQIIRVYRARAIEIIKELEGKSEDARPSPVSIRDRIARDLSARVGRDVELVGSQGEEGESSKPEASE